MRSFDELSATMPTGKDSNIVHIVEKHVVDTWSRILSSRKNSKKDLDSYCFCDFLSLKNYVNELSKSNKRENFF